MVSVDQIQKIANDVVDYIIAHPSVFISAFGAIAIILAYGWFKPKRQTVSPAPPLPATNKTPLPDLSDRLKARPPYTYEPYVPDLPLPDTSDHAYARRILGRDDFTAQEAWQLYFDGKTRGDRHMAMTGLRFYTQFIFDGGYQNYTTPWREYETLGEGYLSLARAHNSVPCLRLAYTSYSACYANIYSEPSTAKLSSDILELLNSLSKELAAHPNA